MDVSGYLAERATVPSKPTEEDCMTETTISTPPANEAITLPPSNGCPSYPRRARRTNRDTTGSFKAEFVLNVLRKWWKLVVPLGLGLAVAMGAVLFVTHEPEYEASAWLRIKETTPFVVVRSQDYSQSFSETQIQLIRSPLVLGTVIAQPEIAGILGEGTEEAKMRWLVKQLDAQPVGSSELVKVSLETTNPERSARIVNAVVDAYLELQNQDNATQTQKVIETLEKEREARSKEVARLRDRIRELAQQTGHVSSANAESASQVNGPATELQTRLADAELQRDVLKSQITALEKSIATGRIHVSESRLDVAVDERAEVEQLYELLSEKRLKLHDIATRSASGEQDPFYQQLSQEIRSDKQTLEQLQMELRTQIKPVIEREVLNERKKELDDLRAELVSRELAAETLAKRLEVHLNQAKQLSGKALQLQYEREELTQAEERLDRIASRLIELRTEGDAPARISLLKPAAVPTTPVELAPVKAIAFVSLLGLLAPFGIVLVWERALRRVSDAEELEQSCNLSVLAEIPRLPDSVSPSARAADEHTHRDLAMFEESVDGLRSCLMLSEPLKHMRVLAVTSATSQEGKTSVAAQLAVSIARATGEDTLLIDGDARSPDMHRLFDVPLEPGLCEVLDGRSTVPGAIRASRYEGLYVLPAGKLPASPNQVFRRQSVQSLLDEVRSSFRHVVVDTPPVLGASEALCLANAADVCVVCARWDISRIDRVRAACERLFSADVCPVGIVLNGVPFRHYAYRYGRYAYAPTQANDQTVDTPMT